MAKGAYSYNTREWQPLVGCANDKPCLARCWAHPAIRRTVKCLEKDHPERAAFFSQFVTPTGWSGKVAIDEEHLNDPLKWRDGQIVAAGYHGDVGLLPPDSLARIFKVMAWCRQHQYLILSKRLESLVTYSEGMARLTPERRAQALVADADGIVVPIANCGPLEWPFPNVWIGASVEDGPSARERLRWLRKLALAGWNTWISYEPATGPVDWEKELNCNDRSDGGSKTPGLFRWLVAGAESGKEARPSHPDWFRAARDACVSAGVKFYFKQWGEWAPVGRFQEVRSGDEWLNGEAPVCPRMGDIRGYESLIEEDTWLMERIGKKNSGYLLDGQLWDQTPWKD